MQTSNFNLETLNTESLEAHITASIQAKSNIAVFGKRGAGKTAIARARIQAADHDEAYMNLSMYERADISGYPFPPSKENKAEQFVSYMLPRVFEPMMTGNRPCVLFLDEVDKAERELWSPLLEISQDKAINGRKLTNLVCCIMTGNLISEGGARPALPLLDRTEAYLVEASAQYWLRWASASGEIHPSIFQFVSDHPNLLHDDGGSEENYKGPSPRGYHLASKLIFIGEQNGWSLDLLDQKVSGQIGKKIGLDFKIYHRNYRELLPMVDAVFSDQPYLDNYKGLKPTEKLYAATIICSRLASILDASDPSQSLPPAVDLVGKFLQVCGHENTLIAVRSQIRPARIVKFKLDENATWAAVFKDVKKSAGIS